jgi:outer membrane protein
MSESMKTKLLPLLLLLALPAQADNLSQVYQRALGFDARYAGARAQLAAGSEALPQARAGLLPNASLAANLRHNNYETSVSARTQNISHGWSVSLTQPLYRKQNFVAYDQGKLQVAAAETQFRQAEQDLIQRVARAYFDVLLAQDSVAFVRAQKTAIAEQLASAKRNFEVGTATIVDTHEAQARFDLAHSQEIAALNDLEVKRQALARIAGGAPETLAGLTSEFKPDAPNPARMDDWAARAESDNPAVALADANRAIAEREIDRNRAGHHPTLDLAASYSDNRNLSSSAFTLGAGGAVSVDSQTGVIGLELAVPIYQGGLTSSRTRQAVALHDKARTDLDEARREAALNARIAYLNVTSGTARVQALEQARVSSQSTLDSTRLGLEVGVRTNIDVLNAEQQLTSARRDLAAAKYDLILAGLALRAAVGSLSEVDLAEVDRHLTGTVGNPPAPAPAPAKAAGKTPTAREKAASRLAQSRPGAPR